MRAAETLLHLGETKGTPDWNALMTSMGMSQTGKNNFRAYQVKLEGDGLTPHQMKLKEQEYLQKALDKMERVGHERTRAKTYFDLTPDAKRMLRFMDKTQSKPTSNSGGDARSYAAQAVYQTGGGK
jgi:hypothetical protein